MNWTKLILKLLIISYAIWRFVLSSIHIIQNNMEMSSKTMLSYSIFAMNLLLLTGTLTESKFFLEIWMICFILKFGAIVFSVFDLDVERHTIIHNNKAINTVITSSKFIKKLLKQLSGAHTLLMKLSLLSCYSLQLFK